MRVNFIYEGDRVKVKVTAAKKPHKIPYSHTKTLISNDSSSVEGRAVKFACSVGFLDVKSKCGFV